MEEEERWARLKYKDKKKKKDQESEDLLVAGSIWPRGLLCCSAVLGIYKGLELAAGSILNSL